MTVKRRDAPREQRRAAGPSGSPLGPERRGAPHRGAENAREGHGSAPPLPNSRRRSRSGGSSAAPPRPGLTAASRGTEPGLTGVGAERAR